MRRRGAGTLLFTSSTAAFRGNAGQHAHSAAMGARRNLCQSLRAELAPEGVHVCHVNIDGTVDAPESIGKILMPKVAADSHDGKRRAGQRKPRQGDDRDVVTE